jgi:hypothetical protein
LTDDLPVVRALRSLLAFLERQRIDYMLMGGMAIRTLAIPRPTFDVDLQIVKGEADARSFAQRAAEGGYSVDEAHLRGFVDHLEGLSKMARASRREIGGSLWASSSAVPSTSARPSGGDASTRRTSAALADLRGRPPPPQAHGEPAP